jgi:uncharacterized protein YjiS (DUF1127 family)
MHVFDGRSAPLFAAPRSALSIGEFLGSLVRRYRAAMTYRELTALDDRQLADIGLSRDDIAGVTRSLR